MNKFLQKKETKIQKKMFNMYNNVHIFKDKHEYGK